MLVMKLFKAVAWLMASKMRKRNGIDVRARVVVGGEKVFFNGITT